MKKFILLLALLPACAPLPGPNLLPGIDHAVEQEQVDISVTVGFWETQVECHAGLWRSGNWHVSVLSCLVNFCIIPVCNTAYQKNGIVASCDIFMAWEWGWSLEHDLMHCQGYADKLY